MASLSEHHMQLNENGIGKCSVPMWCNGLPAGFCDAPAFGKRPQCETYRDRFGTIHRMDGKYDGYVPALACPNHGGPNGVAQK